MSDEFLRWAEEALRDIGERIEHCGGGPDEVNRQVNAILDRYWRRKSQAVRDAVAASADGLGTRGGRKA